MRSLNNNYFSCGREAFFFDDRSYDSIRNAFDAAKLYNASVGNGLTVRVYRRPRVEGDWNAVRAVEGDAS